MPLFIDLGQLEHLTALRQVTDVIPLLSIDTDLLLPRQCVDRRRRPLLLIAHLPNVLVQPLDLLFELLLDLIDIDVLIVRQLWGNYRRLRLPRRRSLALELLGLCGRSLFGNRRRTRALMILELVRRHLLTVAHDLILLDGLKPALVLSPSLLVLYKSPLLLQQV